MVLDVVMPGMSGFDVCSALRALPDCRHVPILMQTSLDDMESVNRAYNAGATDFSSKGINPMLLAQRVKFLVRAKQTQDQLRESEARVRYLAYYDPLTALPNRQRLLQILEQQVAWAAPRQRGIAVLMLDVDNFSRINDTQGQAVGDALLKEVAHPSAELPARRAARPGSGMRGDRHEGHQRLGGAHRRRRIRAGAARRIHGRQRPGRGATRAARPGAAVRVRAAGDTAVGDHRHQPVSGRRADRRRR